MFFQGEMEESIHHPDFSSAKLKIPCRIRHSFEDLISSLIQYPSENALQLTHSLQWRLNLLTENWLSQAKNKVTAIIGVKSWLPSGADIMLENSLWICPRCFSGQWTNYPELVILHTTPWYFQMCTHLIYKKIKYKTWNLLLNGRIWG